MLVLGRILRVFLGLGTAILGLVSLLLILSFLILWQPQWFVHEKSLRWTAEHILPPFGVELGFDSADISFSKEDFYRRQLDLKFKNLWRESSGVHLRLTDAFFAMNFNLKPSQLSVTRLGPVLLRDLDLEIRAGAPEPHSEPLTIDPKWYRRLASLEIEPIRIQSKRIVFTPYHGKPFEAVLDLRLSRSPDLGPLHFELAAQNIKGSVPEFAIVSPRAQAAIDFIVDPEKGPKLLTVGPVDLLIKSIDIAIPAPDPYALSEPPKTHPKSAMQTLIDQVKNLRINPSSIVVDGFSYRPSGKVPIKGNLSLRLSQIEARKIDLALRMRALTGLALKEVDVYSQVWLPEGSEILPLKADLKASAKLGRLGQGQLKGSLRIDSPRDGDYDLEASYAYGPSRLKASSHGQIRKGQMAIDLLANIINPHEKVKSLVVDHCGLTGRLDQENGPFLSSLLSCRIAAERRVTADEGSFRDLLPRTFRFDIEGPISIPTWDKDPHFLAPLTLSLEPLASESFRLRSQTHLKLAGSVFGSVEDLAGTVELDTELLVPHFQTLVHRLAQTRWSIPAPFSTLDGQLSCAAKGKILIKGGLVHLPISCQSDLDSQSQSLWVRAEGLIQTRSDAKPLIQAEVSLEKITLELPKISLDEALPQLFPDKRFITIQSDAIAKTSDPLPFELDLKIKTPEARPFKLATQLTPIPIPISIDLSIRGDRPDLSGSIAVEQYELSFFKRKAFVQHLRMTLGKEFGSDPLDGLIRFNDPDFKIDLKLSGTVSRPFYAFESRPPRSQSEIISIILFGGGADDLDLDSQRSVADTRAAMIDGAIGLLSMYYLASTPIETVGYNPRTGLFRARVRLGKTVSLTVGSDLGGASQSIGLRKRISENWSFETTALTDEQTKTNHGVAMFRWGRRY